MSSCDELFEFKQLATIQGSNGYSFTVNNENYGDFIDDYEFWDNLIQNLSGSVSITIETEEDVKFELADVSFKV